MTCIVRQLTFCSFVVVIFSCSLSVSGQTNQNRANLNRGATTRPMVGQQNRPFNQQQQRNVRQQPTQRRHQTVAAPAPKGFPITASQQQRVDLLLNHWEKSSSIVKRIRCDFSRWKYDSTVCNYINPADRKMVYHELSKGKIQFSNPDKALVAVEHKWITHPPNAQNPKLQIQPYKGKRADEHQERWICNGKSILYYDYFKQQIIKSDLPKELQGNGLKNSPLPFFFGAKAAELKSRYWVRELPSPKGSKDEWWLEIYPKRRQDAEFYSRTIVILEGKSFLPKVIQMFKPGHNPNKMKLADGSTRPPVIQYDVYQFEKREINFRETLVKLWNDSFNPRTPFGWRQVNKTLGNPQPGNLRHATGPSTMNK